jgi:hypothetical protein
MSHLHLILALFFSSLLVALYAIRVPHSGHRDFASTQKLQVEDKIQRISNKHLFMTAKELEITARKRNAENYLQAPYVGQKVIDMTYAPVKGVDHSADRNEETAYRDLRRHEPEFNLSSPQHIVQNELRERQDQAAYVESYRTEYARQFVENARRAGYDVRLSADLVVLSVRKLKSMPK